MLEVLVHIYNIAYRICNQVDLAHANKNQCKRLGLRVKLTVDTVRDLEKKYDDVQYQPALTNLCVTLQHCDEFIGQFGHKNWVQRVFKAGNDKLEFEAINLSLLQANQLLSLGINIQQVFDHEQDKSDQAADQAAIMEMLFVIETAVNANHKEQMAAHKALQEIIAQQFVSMRESFEVKMGRRMQPKYNIDPKLHISVSDIDILEKIAEGSLGFIYKGTWNNRTVAVKTLKLQSAEGEKALVREAQIMSSLIHPNITPFYGVCLEAGRVCLIMAHLQNGSLYDFLLKKKLSLTEQHTIALGIVEGLAYLHQQNKLHRDLKSKNVLLNDKLQPKLHNFGLAKVLGNTVINSAPIQDTFSEWAAPETLRNIGHYTVASDVYSLGVVLWEVFTQKRPHSQLSQMRTDMPSTVPSVYVKIISACLDQEPNKRPVLTDIMQQLKTYETHHEIDSRNIYSQAQEQESKKNFFVAFELYKQSAELGYKRGYTNVGTFYLTGRGGVVPVDKPQAYTWFLQGAKAGHARAQYNAAEMLNTGDGIPKDQRAARQWYRTAARQQYEIAKIRCAELNIDTARSRSVSPK